MPKVLKKIVATTGTYKDAEGNEKKRYTQVGVLMQQDDGGFSIKLDAIPVGPSWSGWLSCYDLDSKKDAQQEDALPGVPF